MADLTQIFGRWWLDDRISGTAAGDNIKALAGDDTVGGGLGHDRLHGGHGNDRLFGGRGNDEMFGDRGSDFMKGGPGNDVYWATGNGRDHHDRVDFDDGNATDRNFAYVGRRGTVEAFNVDENRDHFVFVEGVGKLDWEVVEIEAARGGGGWVLEAAAFENHHGGRLEVHFSDDIGGPFGNTVYADRPVLEPGSAWEQMYLQGDGTGWDTLLI